MAFIDGQNLYFSARESFGYAHPNYDVQALAASTCRRQGWELIETRFYTGIPDRTDNPFWHHFWSAKLAVMGRQGVRVFSRALRYRNKTVRLPDGSTHTFLAGEEKGIDVRIALDVIRMAHRGEYDVALIFSQDQDLSEVADEVRVIAREQDRWIKVACAFPFSPTSRNRRGINKTDWLRIDRAVYEECLDHRDYRPPKSQEVVSPDTWLAVQLEIDSCACRREAHFQLVDEIPGRPPAPKWRGQLLLLSEAPPAAGGFWRVDIDDALRRNLIGLIGELRLAFPTDVRRALDAFQSAGFFLLQTLKWPLLRDFNHLGPDQRVQLIAHAAGHLRREFEILAPRGILAMGSAAWQVCRELSDQREHLPAEGIEAVRGRNYELTFRGRPIPLNVTYLPVDQNMRIEVRASVVRSDLRAFLDRHAWAPLPLER